MPPQQQQQQQQQHEDVMMVNLTMMPQQGRRQYSQTTSVEQIQQQQQQQQQHQQHVSQSGIIPSIASPDPSILQEQQRLEDMRDILQVLKSQERKYDDNNDTKGFPKYDDSWRPVMVSWMYSVVDTFALMVS
jgi:hypothetical protein